MKKLLLVLLALPLIGFGQNVNIPDANFKAYLVGNTAINTNGDNQIQVSEAAAFTDTIDCSNMNISNLTGIEAFTALTKLYCYTNQLTSLDVSQNTALIGLECGINQISSLDVSGATALIFLSFEDNQLECLDISNNINLEELHCNDNLLEQLNTRNGNWQNMYVEALNNNLSCVEVDNLGYATANWVSDFDSFVSFSTNCNYTNTCITVTAIIEQTTNKELLKVTDLLGRETKATNQLLFYIYNDGTVEKKVVIE